MFYWQHISYGLYICVFVTSTFMLVPTVRLFDWQWFVQWKKELHKYRRQMQIQTVEFLKNGQAAIFKVQPDIYIRENCEVCKLSFSFLALFRCHCEAMTSVVSISDLTWCCLVKVYREKRYFFNVYSYKIHLILNFPKTEYSLKCFQKCSWFRQLYLFRRGE